ncbi:MAG: Nif3-like dinuclear metal center hexameric protein [Akkermansiaceae bacterium]|nr:Nif3-like dinuclear metal center hexameric protein [Akkermansiaceae bacterium]
MVALNEVIAFLETELKTSLITDYQGSMNGLQLTNSGKVPRVVAAVDASLPVVKAAAEGGAGLLIVHHGMFWQGARPITGAFYQKIKVAMDAGLAIYSSHLPLDIHPVFGNNILLANAIGVENAEPFLDHNRLTIGIRGTWNGTRSELLGKLQSVLNGTVHHCPAGPEKISSVGIITGGAGSEVAKVAAVGVSTFITGEGPHWSFPLAEELGMNVFYGGHYATETFGVKALSEMISDKFSIPWEFIDHPTGL